MKKIMITLLAMGSMSAFANCTVSFSVYDREAKLENDLRLVETIEATAKKVLKEKNMEIVPAYAADYKLSVATSYIAFQFDGTRGVPVDGFAVAILQDLQNEVLFQSKKVKNASSFLFIPARYDKIVAKAVKKALKEVSCPQS